MYYDTRLVLSDNQNLASAGPLGAALTNGDHVVDLRVNTDVSEGHNTYVRFVVGTTFQVGGGTPRLVPLLLTADNAALSSNVYCQVALGGGTPLLLGATDVIGSLAGFLATSLQAGRELLMPLPPMQLIRQRYLGIAYMEPSWATAFFSAGRITAHIVHAPPQRGLFPDAI